MPSDMEVEFEVADEPLQCVRSEALDTGALYVHTILTTKVHSQYNIYVDTTRITFTHWVGNITPVYPPRGGPRFPNLYILPKFSKAICRRVSKTIVEKLQNMGDFLCQCYVSH
jgi:hypothetical protein